MSELLESDFSEKVNPIREYFDNLKPVSGDPIGQMAATITLAGDPNMKEQQDDMFRLFFTKWLVGAVANVYLTDRCANQLCFIIAGPQGTFKSTWIRNLCLPALSDYYIEGSLDPDNKDSIFRSYAGTKPKPVNLLTWLTSDKYADQIQKLRTLEDKAARDRIKASLPAITVSGTFHPARKEEHLVKHSKLICIDIDLKGNEHIANFTALKEQLFHIENVAYAGLSASGKGFFLIIPIAYPKRHKEQFAAIHRDFSGLGLAIDAAPKNVASLRGYSWDPDAFFRHQARPYRKWVKPEAAEKKKTKFVKSFHASPGTDTRTSVERLIQQIVERRIDITHDEEYWWRLSCAFANEFGEEGRGYFHAISQFYPGYDRQEADKKFDHALKGKYRRIGIGTFFAKIGSL